MTLITSVVLLFIVAILNLHSYGIAWFDDTHSDSSPRSRRSEYSVSLQHYLFATLPADYFDPRQPMLHFSSREGMSSGPEDAVLS